MEIHYPITKTPAIPAYGLNVLLERAQLEWNDETVSQFKVTLNSSVQYI